MAICRALPQQRCGRTFPLCNCRSTGRSQDDRLPALIPLGNQLKASYLQDGNREDIQAVREAIDWQKRRYDIARLSHYGEQKLYRDLFIMQQGRNRSASMTPASLSP